MASSATWRICRRSTPTASICIDAVVDRLVVRSDGTPRLAESISLALRHGEGLLVACYQDQPEHADAETRGRARN